MAVKPFLERQSGESGVIPPAVGCLNRRSEHHPLHLAVTIHRTVALCPAVAPFRIGCVASWGSWQFADVVDGGLIMLPDDRGHVRHAAVVCITSWRQSLHFLVCQFSIAPYRHLMYVFVWTRGGGGGVQLKLTEHRSFENKCRELMTAPKVLSVKFNTDVFLANTLKMVD